MKAAVVLLCLAGVAAAQQPASKIQLGGNVTVLSGHVNPFTVEASVSSKVRFVDRASPTIGWRTRHEVVRVDGAMQSRLQSDALVKALGLTADQKALLESAINERVAAHDKNYSALKSMFDREAHIRLREAGAPESITRLANLPPTSSDEAERLLKEYEFAELKAENQCIEKLHEILPPRQYQVLLEKWWGARKLYIPLVASYLDLTDEQIKAVRDASMAADQLEFELLNKGGKLDAHSRKEMLMQSRAWNESVYRPFSFLSPKQFWKVRQLLKSWSKTSSYSERLEFLRSQPESEVQLKSELRVLGDLYRRGASESTL